MPLTWIGEQNLRSSRDRGVEPLEKSHLNLAALKKVARVLRLAPFLCFLCFKKAFVLNAAPHHIDDARRCPGHSGAASKVSSDGSSTPREAKPPTARQVAGVEAPNCAAAADAADADDSIRRFENRKRRV